jgi:hypothetical protein
MWMWRRVTRNGFGQFFWNYCLCMWNRSGKRLVWPQLRIRAFVSLPCSPMKFICKWLAWRSRYGERSVGWGREKFPQIVQTSSGIHPAPYSVGTGVLSRGWISWGVKFTANVLPVRRLKVGGGRHLLPLYAFRAYQGKFHLYIFINVTDILDTWFSQVKSPVT